MQEGQAKANFAGAVQIWEKEPLLRLVPWSLEWTAHGRESDAM
jgi:hypothetical protein